jgi:hypothetical protein
MPFILLFNANQFLDLQLIRSFLWLLIRVDKAEKFSLEQKRVDWP